MFVRKSGRTKIIWLPVTASTALTGGGLLTFTTGRLTAAGATTAAKDIVGVLVKTIAATDTDYADTRNVEVEVPTENFVQWEANVTATCVVADVGLYCDLTDYLTVNRDASTYDVVYVTKYLSTTKAVVVLNIGPAGAGTT